MAKTSFRLEEALVQKLVDLADKNHRGNKTAAVAAAIEQYHAGEFGEILGWVELRVTGKVHCVKCNARIDVHGFLSVDQSGRLVGRVHCPKCAR